MDTANVIRMANELMEQWGLVNQGWSVGFNRRKKAMGLCHYPKKRIELSVYFVANNPPERIRETILHEIAHALAGPKAGHGLTWRLMARKVGAPPVRCGQAVMPEGSWKATCQTCGKTHTMHRKPKRKYRCLCSRLAPTLAWTR